MKRQRFGQLVWLAALGLVLWPSTGWAVVLDVGVDTSNIGNYTAPYGIDFTLLQGDPANANTVTIGSFTFGGGSPTGTPMYTNGAAGDLSTAVILTDVGFINDFNQGFTPGSSLTFKVTLPDSPSVGAAPDNFSMVLFQQYGTGGQTTIPTTGPNDVFLSVDLQTPYTFNTYNSAAGDITITASPEGSTTPEPASATLMLLSVVGLAAGCGWRRLRARAV